MSTIFDSQTQGICAVFIREEHCGFRLGQHIAHIATAVNGANASRGQDKRRHAFHGSPVVAAEEGAYIVDAGTVPRIVGFNGFVGQVATRIIAVQGIRVNFAVCTGVIIVSAQSALYTYLG